MDEPSEPDLVAAAQIAKRKHAINARYFAAAYMCGTLSIVGAAACLATFQQTHLWVPVYVWGVIGGLALISAVSAWGMIHVHRTIAMTEEEANEILKAADPSSTAADGGE